MEKLCINCAHCLLPSTRSEYHQCYAPQNREPAKASYLVTGDESQQWRYIACETQRNGDAKHAEATNSCGPQGRWFEPKDSGERLVAERRRLKWARSRT